MTDLNAESETIPLHPPREDWTGHKGMVQAAQYILNKIEAEELIERARNRKPERGTNDFEIVIVGHSLGAGTASILGILLRETYSTLQCFCYAPPGGLLSAPVVEYTKEFTVSVVVGKDVVPRIGLYQMETLRTDLINAIKRSVDPKVSLNLYSAIINLTNKYFFSGRLLLVALFAVGVHNPLPLLRCRLAKMKYLST